VGCEPEVAFAAAAVAVIAAVAAALAVVDAVADAAVAAAVVAAAACYLEYSAAEPFVAHAAELDRAADLVDAVDAVVDVDFGLGFVADPSAGSDRVVELGLLAGFARDLEAVHFGVDDHGVPCDFAVFYLAHLDYRPALHPALGLVGLLATGSRQERL